jgi:glycosyltransferase involved in cell wall biosynthesis
MKIIDLVSVIIPCFNNQDTIVETLNSVCNQNYSNLEIIIVNDGSSDNSQNIIEAFIVDKVGFHFIQINQTNQGPSRTRNNGANIATGKYLLFLDADDLLDTTYINKCVEILESNSDINIVYSDIELFGSQTGKWELQNFSMPQFLVNNCIPISALIKKEVFDKVGQFDENLSFTEDWELWIRIVKQFGGVYKIPELLFFYRKREDKSSLTDNKDTNLNDEKSRLYIYNKHYDLYKKYNLDLLNMLIRLEKLEKINKKYYAIWYKKLFYKFKKK